MRVPGRIAIASAAVLIVLGIPFFSINFTSVDASVLPESASARQVDDALQDDFPPFRDSPIQLAVAGGNERAAEVAKAAGELEGVASVSEPRPLEGGLSVVEVVSKNAPLSDASQDLVERARGLEAELGGNGEVLVTGFTADYVDLQESLVDHLPLVLLIVSIATFIVLFLMTGSVILPLKQLVMNLLGLSAVFGILVLIFQDGRFEGLLDYTSQGGLESTQPLLLFAIAFGLSTDYGVFLLSRIKEARDGGASDSEAVAIGLERTGRIVTAAALLFCIAIGAFVTSDIVFIKQVGLGTALAVLIDATIIRALLVPSLMELLGKWNWWAPRPLRRLHERIGLSEVRRRAERQPGVAAGRHRVGSLPVTAAMGIFLIALGAIIRYAINFEIAGVDEDTIGLILMIAGAAVLVLGLIQMARARTPRGHRRAPGPPLPAALNRDERAALG